LKLINQDGRSDGSPAGCPAAGTPMTNYGVNIEPDGRLTGYAWSEHIGWIKMNPSGPYPSCPSTTCPSGSPNWSSKVDLATKKVTGWARACGIPPGSSTEVCGGDGWDGWILLGPIVKSGVDYGVFVNNTTKEFQGWAWGSDVVGWISFNRLNCDSNADGVTDTGNSPNCPSGQPITNYKVYTTFSFNAPPSATNLNNPNTTATYCGVLPGEGVVTFTWRYSDPDNDPQSRYELQINNGSLPPANQDICSDCEVQISRINRNDPSPTTDSETIPIRRNTPNPGDNYLTFNTTYQWRVRVWDNQGNNSGWVYGTSNFTSAQKAYPWPNFTHNPQKPTVGEEVRFNDNSTCYNSSNNPVPCRSTSATYSWNFGDGTPPSSVKGNTTHTFLNPGSYLVNLTINDPTIGSCTGSGDSPVQVEVKLPEFEEIIPF
jgi:hypothetical protein